MSTNCWFARLDPVHCTDNRVRWRYACHAETPQAAKDIALAAKNLPGVRNARVNSGARSLIVEFDEKLTRPEKLARQLLALPPPKSLPTTGKDSSGEPQLTAVAVSLGLLEDHVGHCVVDAARKGGPESEEKLAEASAAIARMVRS